MNEPVPAPGGAPAPGDPAPAPTFTQADLNRMIGERTAASKRDAEAAVARATAAEAKAAEQAARIEVLETATLSAGEKAKRDSEKAARSLEEGKAAADRIAAEKTAEAEAARKETAALRIEHATASAMSAIKLAGVPGTPEADNLRRVVLRSLLEDIERDTDETGKITAVRYAGLAKKDLPDAVKAWAAANPWAIESAGGGSGAGGNGRGAGGAGGKAPSEMTKDELAAAAAEEQRARRR